MNERVHTVLLRVRVLVKNTKKLIAYSKQRARECRGDPEWAPEDIADAVKNVLVIMPDPSLKEMGLELVAAEVDMENE